jgi:hypothetical protein
MRQTKDEEKKADGNRNELGSRTSSTLKVIAVILREKERERERKMS